MRLLVIEDSQQHRDSARKFFADKGVDVTFLKDLKSFLKMFAMPSADGLETPDPEFRFDGVLADIFLPHDEKYFPEVVPAGVAVFFTCQTKGIPCLFVTAGFHHGQKYQWIHEMVLMLGLPQMIDGDYNETNGGKNDASEKNWDWAFKSIVEMIKNQKS